MLYSRVMEFEWDPQKNDINLRKHGVSFEEAETVFKNPLALIFDDQAHSSPEEYREIIIGHSACSRVLLVWFTERSGSIRLISARPATKRELNDYEFNLFL